MPVSCSVNIVSKHAKRTHQQGSRHTHTKKRANGMFMIVHSPPSNPSAIDACMCSTHRPWSSVVSVVGQGVPYRTVTRLILPCMLARQHQQVSVFGRRRRRRRTQGPAPTEAVWFGFRDQSPQSPQLQ